MNSTSSGRFDGPPARAARPPLRHPRTTWPRASAPRSDRSAGIRMRNGGAANDLAVGAELQHLSRKATVHGAEKNHNTGHAGSTSTSSKRDAGTRIRVWVSIRLPLTSLDGGKYRAGAATTANSSRSSPRNATAPLHIVRVPARSTARRKSLAVQASCLFSKRKVMQFQSDGGGLPPPMHRLARRA